MGGGVLHQLSHRLPATEGILFLTPSALGQVNPFDGQPPTWEPSYFILLTGINKVSRTPASLRLFEPHCTDGETEAQRGRERGMV